MIFKQIKKKSVQIVFLLFINNLEFITSQILVKEIAKTLDKSSKFVSEWEAKNAVIYDIVKTKLVLFFQIQQQHKNQQLQEITVIVREKKIKFNKNIT